MIGTVSLKDLKVHCIIGIHPFERETSQDLFFDINMEVDFSKASQTEDINQAVDYSAVAQIVEDFTVAGKFLLIETLADKLIEELFKNFSLIENCEIAIKKPAAVPKAKYAMVRLSRGRK